MLVEPVRDHGRAQSDDAATLLLKTMVEVIRDGHLNAIVKCAPFGWLLLRGKLTFDKTMADLLRDYPRNEATRSIADSMIRASFGAQKGATEFNKRGHDRSRDWARAFWNPNWRMFPCFPEEDGKGSPQLDPARAASEDADEETTQQAGGETNTDHVSEPATHTKPDQSPIERTVSVFDAFLSEVLDNDNEVDLYSPAKHEVIGGLVSRAARSVFATLRAPHLWSGEHGMSTMRILSETRIVLSWMSRQDPDVYERYQDFGRGKAKLMKIHMQDLAASFQGEPPQQLSEALEHFDKRFGGQWGEQFQEVNLDATFSGLSVRQMAFEVGLEDEYRHIYQPASGISHGEWWTIEDYAMQRCMNPLHLFHRIPSFDPEFPITAGFGGLLADRLDELAQHALQVLFAEGPK